MQVTTRRAPQNWLRGTRTVIAVSVIAVTHVLVTGGGKSNATVFLQDQGRLGRELPASRRALIQVHAQESIVRR
jgi:hypothetical protein